METVKEKLMKLILAFGECPADRCLACEYQYEHDCGALMFAEQLIQNGVTIQEWVSVDERLPEKDKEYIVMINGAKRSTHLYFDGEAWFNEYGNTYKVLKWMEMPPLPQPPKGVQ